MHIEIGRNRGMSRAVRRYLGVGVCFKRERRMGVAKAVEHGVIGQGAATEQCLAGLFISVGSDHHERCRTQVGVALVSSRVGSSVSKLPPRMRRNLGEMTGPP